MSLINDALKRAQEAQRPNIQSSVASIRTVDSRPRENLLPSRLLVVVIFLLLSAAFAFIGLAVTGRLAQKSAAAPQATKALPVTPAPAPDQPTPPSTTSPAVTTVPATPVPAPTPTLAPAPAAVAVAPVVPTPPPVPLVLPDTLHVQGIGFESTRPWAIVSGRTVYVGDSIKGVRVMGITRSTVTFGRNGQTNLLYVGQ